MQDLRLFAKNLEGKKIKADIDNRRRVYTIEKVYPYYVKARTKCENGYEFTVGFSIGDLIQQGLIGCAGQRLIDSREPHGHSDYSRWGYDDYGY